MKIIIYGMKKDAEVELSISEVRKLYDLAKEVEREEEERDQRRNVRRPRY